MAKIHKFVWDDFYWWKIKFVVIEKYESLGNVMKQEHGLISINVYFMDKVSANKSIFCDQLSDDSEL